MTENILQNLSYVIKVQYIVMFFKKVKLGGEKLIAEGAATLNKLESKIDSEKMYLPSFKMVLTAIGNYAYLREDGVWVVPIGSLKP